MFVCVFVVVGGVFFVFFFGGGRIGTCKTLLQIPPNSSMLDPLLSSRTKTPSPKLTSYSAEENEKKFLFLCMNTSVAFGGSSQKSRPLRALQSPQVTPLPSLEKARFSLQSQSQQRCLEE